MQKLYRGYNYSSNPIGSYESGKIYREGGMFPELIGSYEDGKIYRRGEMFPELIGSYENGMIFRGYGLFSEFVGSYKNGKIYQGSVGVLSEIIGTYDGDDEGAAAAAFILLFDEEDIMDKNPETKQITNSVQAAQMSENSKTDFSFLFNMIDYLRLPNKRDLIFLCLFFFSNIGIYIKVFHLEYSDLDIWLLVPATMAALCGFVALLLIDEDEGWVWYTIYAILGYMIYNGIPFFLFTIFSAFAYGIYDFIFLIYVIM